MTTLTAETRSRSRLYAVDAMRGLAVLLMFVDHGALFLGGADPIRHTLGRLALPLFFMVSGACFGRLHRRHVGVLLIGLALPAVVPWIDAPNVLVWYVLGCCALALARNEFVLQVVAVAAALTMLANGYAPWANDPNLSTYEPLALVALMILGRWVGPDFFAWGDRLPVVFGWLGRHALAVYVAHLLVLEALVLAR